MKRRVTQPSVPLALKLPNLLSVEEVAAAIHRHPEVVRRQARDGRLPAEKIGRVWFFRPERLAEAGFSQFLPRMASEAATHLPTVGPGTEGLLRALSDAGLEALQHPDRDARPERTRRALQPVPRDPGPSHVSGSRTARITHSKASPTSSDGSSRTCDRRRQPTVTRPG